MTDDIAESMAQARQRECKDKTQYPSEREAQKVADIFARTTGKERRTYKCPWCKKWHQASCS